MIYYYIYILYCICYRSTSLGCPEDILFSKDAMESLFTAIGRVKKADTDEIYRTFPAPRKDY